MALSDELFGLWNIANTADGNFTGKVWNIYRPNYSAAAPVTVQGEQPIFVRKFRAEAGAKSAEPNLPEVEYYSIKGDIRGLKQGDVFIDPSGVSPTMTLINLDPLKDTVCFRTDRVGSVYNDLGSSAVLSSVRYDWMKRSNFLSSANDVINSIEGAPSRKVVMYAHPAILPQDFWMQGKRLLESDGQLNPSKRWMIKIVEYIRPLVIFHLEEESGSN